RPGERLSLIAPGRHAAPGEPGTVAGFARIQPRSRTPEFLRIQLRSAPGVYGGTFSAEALSGVGQWTKFPESLARLAMWPCDFLAWFTMGWLQVALWAGPGVVLGRRFAAREVVSVGEGGVGGGRETNFPKTEADNNLRRQSSFPSARRVWKGPGPGDVAISGRKLRADPPECPWLPATKRAGP